MRKMSLERVATLTSSLTATILILIKLSIGIASGSVAVLASAVDSVLDLIVSAFNYFAIKKSETPPDKIFNYGRGKIEALAAVIEGTIIAVSGLFIFYSAIKKAYLGSETSYIGAALWVMMISLILTFALVLFLQYVSNKTGSLVIKSDALHYKTDLLSNGAVLISLVIVYFSGIELVDSLIGLFIAIYIIYSAYGLVKEGVYILLDAALDEEIVENIEKIIKEEELVTSFHNFKTRRSAHTNYVEVHLVFNSSISLLYAHFATEKIEDRIRNLDIKEIWDINIHLDPYDDSLEDSEALNR
jgi:cation diffusion facilitator family transporter